jgi:hypothetical protein
MDTFNNESVNNESVAAPSNRKLIVGVSIVAVLLVLVVFALAVWFLVLKNSNISKFYIRNVATDKYLAPMVDGSTNVVYTNSETPYMWTYNSAKKTLSSTSSSGEVRNLSSEANVLNVDIKHPVAAEVPLLGDASNYLAQQWDFVLSVDSVGDEKFYYLINAGSANLHAANSDGNMVQLKTPKLPTEGNRQNYEWFLEVAK